MSVKVLIVYDSETGSTEKMAFAVAEGARHVSGTKVVVKKADKTKLEDLLDADGIIIGSPTYFGQMSAKLKALLDESVKIHEKLEGKVGAAFTSAGGTATGAETTLLSILKGMLMHACREFPVPDKIGLLRKKRFSRQEYLDNGATRVVENWKQLREQ